MGACLHCEDHEPGNTSSKALVATIRKRLSQACESVPPWLRRLQVQEPMPAQALMQTCRDQHRCS